MYSFPSLLLLSASLIPTFPEEAAAKPAPPQKVLLIKETRSRGDGSDLNARAQTSCPLCNRPIVSCDHSVVRCNVLMAVKRSGRESVVARTRVPASTLEHGLDLLPKSLKPAITLAAEADGWFFYTTDHVFKDKNGRPRALFIRGYAVQRGSQEVVEFNVW